MISAKLNPDETTLLQAALKCITVYDMWRLLKLDGFRNIPDDGSDYACCSPLRVDRKPSFSVYDNGRRWNDFALSGNGEGDAADFLQAALKISREAAIRLFIGLAGVNGESSPTQSQPYNSFTDTEKAKNRSEWPKFEIPTEAEIEAIANLRGLSPEGVALATKRGLLFCATSKEGHRSWVVTDSRRWNAQARRMDGKDWERKDGPVKALTLRGSIASWPIGIEEAFNFPAIALVEGGPDFLAAFDLILAQGLESAVHPVAMLGASMHIDAAVLPKFKGMRVKIFPHLDDAGQAAAQRWFDQLHGVAASVTGYSFEGLSGADGPVTDLNDLARRLPENPSAEDLVKMEVLLRDAFTI